MTKSDKYIRNIVAGLVLGSCLVTLSAGANELNKLDIKRSNTSGSALNVTIFTANPYNDNIAVTQKSDNKYVILIPNISGNNASNVDFSSIKDIVSDVNVKSVSDGGSGYTKVTLTTSKPVSISTFTKNSTPLTEEQKAYKNLIAQSRGYVSKNTQTNAKTAVEPVKIAAQVKPYANEKNAANQTTNAKPAAQPESQTKPKSMIDKLRDKADVIEATKTTPNTTDAKKSVKEASTQQNTVEGSNNSKNNKSEVIDNESTENKTAKVHENAAKIEVSTPIPVTETENLVNLTNNPSHKGSNTNMLTILFTLLTTAFGLIMLAKAIRNQLEHSVALKRSFKENLHQEPKPAVIDCSDIMDNHNLSWQEKYKTFVNRIEEISPDSGLIRATGNGEYEFVNSADNSDSPLDNIFQIGSSSQNSYSANKSNLKPEHKTKFTSYNAPAMNSEPKAQPIRKVKNQSLKSSDFSKLEIVEPKSNSGEINYRDLISKLDRTLQESPSVERLDKPASEDIIANQFKENIMNDSKSSIVHSEEEVISNRIRTAPKLKSFAQKVALEKNVRKTSLPKQRSEIIKSGNIESQYVNLENSQLYSSARKFKDANLNSSALIAGSTTGMKNLRNTNSGNIKAKEEKNYSEASVEEFLSSSSSSETGYITSHKSLSGRVADSLGKISTGTIKPASAKKLSGNPLENKVIKSSYNIDNNSGFYLVSDELGNCSLVGKVNNSVTVLKNFGTNMTGRLQVRKDNDNVYMVRTGAERFLVELNGEKMGVLIEL